MHAELCSIDSWTRHSHRCVKTFWLRQTYCSSTLQSWRSTNTIRRRQMAQCASTVSWSCCDAKNVLSLFKTMNNIRTILVVICEWWVFVEKTLADSGIWIIGVLLSCLSCLHQHPYWLKLLANSFDWCLQLAFFSTADCRLVIINNHSFFFWLTILLFLRLGGNQIQCVDSKCDDSLNVWSLNFVLCLSFRSFVCSTHAHSYCTAVYTHTHTH